MTDQPKTSNDLWACTKSCLSRQPNSLSTRPTSYLVKGKSVHNNSRQLSEMNFLQRKKNQQPNDAKVSENEEESAPQKPVAKPEPKPVVEEKPEYKFGIAQRLDDATEAQKIWKGPKRSPDLVELSKKYDAMRKSVRQMIISARKYHATREELDSARVKVSC